MNSGPSIVWLRNDLRLADNPALVAATERGEPLLVVYIHDEVSPGIRPLGSATRWWLHHSLQAEDLMLLLLMLFVDSSILLPKLAPRGFDSRSTCTSFRVS